MDYDDEEEIEEKSFKGGSSDEDTPFEDEDDAIEVDDNIGFEKIDEEEEEEKDSY